MDATFLLQSQSLTALERSRQVIVECPAAFQEAPGDKGKFWEKACHALFFCASGCAGDGTAPPALEKTLRHWMSQQPIA